MKNIGKEWARVQQEYRRKSRGRCLLIFGILFALVLINMPCEPKAEQGANEFATISNLRVMTSAQKQYRREKTGGKRYADSLASLSGLGYITGTLFAGEQFGYSFTLKTEDMQSDGSINRWNCHANPVEYGKTGKLYFFVNESGVLRFNTTGPATQTSDSVD